MKNIPLSDIYCPKNLQITLLFRIMRISIFFLFFCAFSLVAKNSHSQNARVTINRTNVQLESILNEIESQTDYLFIYKDDVDVTSRKSIRVNNKSVSEVLLALLSGSSITYKWKCHPCCWHRRCCNCYIKSCLYPYLGSNSYNYHTCEYIF